MAGRTIAGGSVSKTWNETKAAVLEQLRAAYLAEVARFAETLRPRFESGELRGMTDEECENEDLNASSPLFKVENLCEKHFHLRDEDGLEEAFRTAYLIRSVSPGEDKTEDAQPICGQAVIAITHDVLTIAQVRGWYAPAKGEEPTIPIAEARWALEVRP